MMKKSPYASHQWYRRTSFLQAALSGFLLCLTMICCILFASTRVASAKTMLSDSAGLLSTEEASQIEDACDLILQQYDTSVFIITTDKLGKSDDYENYLTEQAKKVASKENLVILFISTKKKDSICQVKSFGSITASLTENRMKKMARSVAKQVEKENYYQGIDRFCDDVTQSLTIKPTLDGLLFQSLPQLLFSLLLGCGVIFYLLHSGKKKHATLTTYLDKKHSKALGRLDHFSYKEVNILKDKKKKKQEEDSENK